jgi:hypothetical protein
MKTGKSLAGRLFHGSTMVARLTDVITHQGTWFAIYAVAIEDANQERLREFINFCEEWHARLRDGKEPDADEFDAFADLVKSDRWHVLFENGADVIVAGAPVFADGEVSWNHPETAPSTEEAAHRLWKTLSG